MSDGHPSGIERPPTPYEQAKWRARDALTLSELTTLVYDLPNVMEVLVDGEDEDWRPTTVTVGIDNEAGRGTDDLAIIMARTGWRFAGATFAPYNRLRFVERGEEA